MDAAKARTPDNEDLRLSTIHQARAQIVKIVREADDELWARQNIDKEVVDDLPADARDDEQASSTDQTDKIEAPKTEPSQTSHPTYGYGQ